MDLALEELCVIKRAGVDSRVGLGVGASAELRNDIYSSRLKRRISIPTTNGAILPRNKSVVCCFRNGTITNRTRALKIA